MFNKGPSFYFTALYYSMLICGGKSEDSREKPLDISFKRGVGQVPANFSLISAPFPATASRFLMTVILAL
jgi:hypothetical protein